MQTELRQHCPTLSKKQQKQTHKIFLQMVTHIHINIKDDLVGPKAR